MAFPDYGPIEMITQYTQDGFRQAAFLFHLYSGKIDDSKALHYIAITFATIGFIAIVLIKKFHDFKTIGCWTFLLLVLVLGPYSTKFLFQEIQVSIQTENKKEQNLKANTIAFTPQLAVVHFMSQIHRAIYVAFFDINSSSPGLRNFVGDITYGSGSFDASKTKISDRPDIIQEITAYTTLCGNPDNLAKRTFNQEWADDLKSNAHLGLSDNQLSAAETWRLQQTIFKIGDFNRLVDNYDKAFRNQDGLIYPPFLAVNLLADNLKGTLAASGVASRRIDEEVGKLVSSNLAENYKKFFASIAYYITDKPRISFAVGNGGITPILNAGSTMSPVISAYINYEDVDDPVLLDHGNKISDTDRSALSQAELSLQKLAELKGIYPDGNWEDIKIWDQKDPIEQRLRGRNYFSNRYEQPQTYTQMEGAYSEEQMESEKWATFLSHGGSTKVRDVATSIAFMTPAPYDIYKSLENTSTSTGNSGGRGDLSRLSKQPYFNAVTNCMQLHAMTRAHILDAVLFKNSWPNHGQNVTVYNARGESATANPGAIAEIDGFSSYANATYFTHPYNSFGGENLSPSMASINQRIQVMMSQLKNKTSGDSGATTKIINPLSEGNLVAAEALRREVAASLIKNALNYTPLPTITRSSGETVGDTKTAKLDKAMNADFSGDNVRQNLAGLSSGLSWFADFFAGLAAKVGANFAGIGAVAFIRFLQIFVAIGLFFIIMCTPILFMMGLIIPSNAPGVIATSIMAPLALKAIPIGFTLVDAVISIAVGPSSSFFTTADDQAIFMYVIAGAYTSITMITFFLLFKAGDTQAVISQMGALDGQANKIADTGVAVTKAVGMAAAAALTAGAGATAMGAAGAKAAGASTGKALGVGLRQGGEVFGKHGLSAIPGAGNFAQEIAGSYREGKGQATVMGEIDSNNASVDANINKINAQLSDPTLDTDTRMSLEAERAREESHRRTYGELIDKSKDAAAENKYRSQISAGKSAFAEDFAESQFKAGAGASGMDTTEARRRALDSKAQGELMGTLGTAIKHQQVNVDEATLEAQSVKLDTGAMNTTTKDTILSARDAARSTQFRTNDDVVNRRAINAATNEIANFKKENLSSTSGKFKLPKTQTLANGDQIVHDASYDTAAAGAMSVSNRNTDNIPKNIKKEVSEGLTAQLYSDISNGKVKKLDIGSDTVMTMRNNLKKVGANSKAMAQFEAALNNAKNMDISQENAPDLHAALTKIQKDSSIKGAHKFQGDFRDGSTASFNLVEMYTKDKAFQGKLESGIDQAMKEYTAAGKGVNKRNS